jgi:hypothetical protein
MGRRWTEESIRRELEAFLPGFDAWPPYPVFRASGRRGLWQAIVQRGGPERFAEEYGLPYTRNDRALGDAEIRARLRATLRGSDLVCWPSRQWLAQRAGTELVAAIDRNGGGRRWAEELGLPVRHLRGQRWTPELIASALEPLLAGRSTWPSRLEFERAGLSGLWFAIHHGEGHAAMPPASGWRADALTFSPAGARRTQPQTQPIRGREAGGGTAAMSFGGCCGCRLSRRPTGHETPAWLRLGMRSGDCLAARRLFVSGRSGATATAALRGIWKRASAG